MTVTGIRCLKCGKEVAHVVGRFEGVMLKYEADLAKAHRRECSGEVVRFREERPSKA